MKNKKNYIIILVTIITIVIVVIAIKPMLENAKINKAEKQNEQRIDEKNLEQGPAELDQEFLGPNEDRPLPIELL